MAEKYEKPVRIIMWGLPRTISSAFAKCMSTIEGMEIWFEPYIYAYVGRDQYRRKYGEYGPMEYEGNEKDMAKAAELTSFVAQSKVVPDRISYKNIKQRLEESTSKYVFVKDMGFLFPDETTRQYIPSGYKHVFLIRDPYRAFYSYRSAMFKQMSKIGVLEGDAKDERKFHLVKDDPVFNAGEFFSNLLDFYRYIKENIDPNVVLLNADDLLTNPAEVLERFCKKMGLPYSDSLLHWDASTDVVKTWKAAGDTLLIDVVNFYKTAMTSSEFLPPSDQRPRETLTSDLLEIADAAMPYFEELNKNKMC